MTFKLSPKEEAAELVDNFSCHCYECGGFAKESALIAVDKILKVAFYAPNEIYEHYLQVKTEIEKL